MDYNNIIYEVNDGVAKITINRPKALNALNPDVLTEMIDAFNDVKTNDDIRVAIVTGSGDMAFVAGADIAAMNDMNTMEGRAMAAQGHEVMNLIESIEKPVIAAVNGFALGGGCELAMSCDIRIASDKAMFGQPEVGLGIIPGFGGTQRLPKLVGRGMAKYLCMTAENIKADEALRIGLVEKVVPAEELMPTVEKLAKKFATKLAPIAVGMAKKVIDTGFEMPIKEGSTLEVDALAITFSTDDKKEGMGAFVEKRKPAFTGK